MALTASGVAIATGALVSMVGFALGVQAKAEEPFQKLELLNRIDVRPEPDSPTAAVLDDAVVARLAALPGVLLAYPEQGLERVEIARDGHVKETSAVGLPRGAGRLRFVRDSLRAGRFFSRDGGSSEAVLGKKLAKNLGFASAEEATGQVLTVRTRGLVAGEDKTFSLEQREVQVTVVGVWDPPQGRAGYTDDGLVLPLDLIQSLPGHRSESGWLRILRGNGRPRPGYERVVVRVERPGALFEVVELVRKAGFRANTFLEQIKELRTAFTLIDLVLTAVGSVALTVAGLGIVNTQLMAVLERHREIGVYKALGASDGDVRWLFMGEAVMVGLAGGVGGLALGRVVSLVIEVVINELARRKGIEEAIVSFDFPAWLLTGAVLFALIVCVSGGVYPAGRAARVDPLRALRSE
jgi:putative ABC transport system permease protein